VSNNVALGDGTEIARTAARGTLVMAGGTIGQAFCQLAVIAVLARLLTPEDFGVLSATLIIVSFANVFTHFGLTAAIVQRPILRSAHIGTAFWFTCLLGVVLMGGAFAVAPFARDVLQVPEVDRAIRWISLTFPLAAVGLVSDAMLQRNFRYSAITLTNLLSYIVGYGGVGITLALSGMGWLALIAAHVSQAFVKSVAVLWISPPLAWRPSRDALAELLNYGGGHSAGQIGNYFAEQGDNVVVARLLGSEALGLYGRAYQLLVMPARMVGLVLDRTMFPALARIQHQPQRLSTAFFALLTTTNLLTFPTTAILVVLAPELVYALLGPQWSGLTLAFQILALGTGLRVGTKVSKALIKATGAVYRGAWRTWLHAVVVVVASLLGARWGIEGVAIGVLAAMMVHEVLMIDLCRGLVAATWSDITARFIPPTAVALVLAALLWLPTSVLRGLGASEWITLFMLGPVALALWIYLVMPAVCAMMDRAGLSDVVQRVEVLLAPLGYSKFYKHSMPFWSRLHL
jgi:O-antigen/teichoic acid export membrane protein